MRLVRDPAKQQELRSVATNALNSLAALRWIERSIEVEYAFLIAQARTEGASWAQIGRKLNITKQAAQQRYGEIVSKITPYCVDSHTTIEDLLDVLDEHYQGSYMEALDESSSNDRNVFFDELD
jgi:hypothetical protein